MNAFHMSNALLPSAPPGAAALPPRRLLHRLRRLAHWPVLMLWALLLAAFQARGADAAYLDVDQAFQLTAQQQPGASVALHWRIAPGYTLYRDRLQIQADGVTLSPALPLALRKKDPASDEVLAVYHDRLDITVPLPPGSRQLSVQYQGCADAGLCYPPEQRGATLTPGGSGPVVWQKPGDADAPLATPAVPAAAATHTPAPQAPVDVPQVAASDATTEAGRVLRSGSGWRVAGLFALGGLLLAFTPCVLPMVPILSSILVGQHGASQAPSRRRCLRLSLAYAGGMAGVYTALGVAAGLAGEGLAGFLQQPPMLIGFALLLAGLSLSMFDVFTLQVPAALQTRLSALSDRAGGSGGSGAAAWGAAAMGALSALMVGPCVAAPLAGALLYIGQTHDVALGALALFSLACGMSVPLLLTGLSAGSLLPRAGAWMGRVKQVFGLLLLAVAWWMVTPLLAAPTQLAGWGVLAIGAAVFLGLGEPMPAQAGPGTRALRAAVIAVAVFGALELAGSALGADDALHPLAPLAASRGASVVTGSPAGGEAPHFAPVTSTAELERALATASRPVLLDFYADWCVACKELERDTLAHPAVARALGGFTLLRADVTANTPEQRALLKRFALFGPPGLVLFDARGQELPQHSRQVGLVAPAEFEAWLRRAVAPAPGS